MGQRQCLDSPYKASAVIGRAVVSFQAGHTDTSELSGLALAASLKQKLECDAASESEAHLF